MKHVVALLIALAVSSTCYAQNSAIIAKLEKSVTVFVKFNKDPKPGIQQRCREEWASDFRMQKYCREKQQEGYHDFWRARERFRKASEDDSATAMLGCIGTWVEETLDWRMLAYCIKNQYEAHSKL